MKKLLTLLFISLLALPGQGFSAPQGQDSALRSSASQSIGDEEVEPKDPFMATVFSIMPGLVFHGAGNFYAGDHEFGTRMLVMEILGGGLALWGHNMIHQPDNWGPYFGNSMPQAGYWVKAAGVGMMAISWIGDVATAPEAADTWNKDHALQFQMDSYDGTGARLMLASKF